MRGGLFGMFMFGAIEERYREDFLQGLKPWPPEE
jgi:hypothetical protein